MKLNVKPVIAKVLGFAQSSAIAAITAATITMTPIAVKAQTPSLTDFLPILSGIELTTQQKIQLAELATQTQTQFEKIVTQDQRTQFQTTLGQGGGFGAAIAAMKITPDQQTQLKDLFRSAQTQFVSNLTPAQRQQILENFRSLLQLGPTQ